MPRCAAASASHTLRFPDGSKKTIGRVYPGEVPRFNGRAERMEIIAGSCAVRLDGQSSFEAFAAGRGVQAQGSGTNAREA
ncbi:MULTISPECIES: pyrimidine/purine nucleoside phosphorylase [Sorangium]|uniref:pyrimidine/purine nucleoside phosphorylase n=1 Tax=Sorangium TaxID=39643 RepID=UPI0009D71299